MYILAASATFKGERNAFWRLMLSWPCALERAAGGALVVLLGGDPIFFEFVFTDLVT
jgi:hypothetical protein